MAGDNGLDHVIRGRKPHQLMVGSAVALGAGIFVMAFGIATARDSVLTWAAVAGAVALFLLYGTVSSARAYTRFGAAGVRMRGLFGGTDEYRWDEIANVARQQVIYPSKYRTGIVWYVVVTTKAGDHVRLGAPAPVSPTGAGPEFTAQFRQIRTAWQDATGITGTPETAPPTWAKEAMWLGLAIGVQVLALAFALVTLPYFVPAWAAHEGEGTRGVFTAGIPNCPQADCSWFGSFKAGSSHAKYVTMEPGGPVIGSGGDTVSAVDTGRNGIVYPVGGATAWELPAAGVTAGTAVVLLLLAGEVLVPVYRRRARHRRTAQVIARPPPADLPAKASEAGDRYGPSSAERPAQRRIVFRNRFIAGLAALVIVPCLVIGVTVLPGPGQQGAYVGGAVLPAMAWLMWVLGWWTKVVVSADGVVIDNVIIRNVIPAAQFDGFALYSGISVTAKDGRRFGLFGYGGSLFGEITRYHSQQLVLTRMNAAAALIAAGNADPQARCRTYVKIPWWPLPVLLILVEGAVLFGHHVV